MNPLEFSEIIVAALWLAIETWFNRRMHKSHNER
jgi:hypothetical protein